MLPALHSPAMRLPVSATYSLWAILAKYCWFWLPVFSLCKRPNRPMRRCGRQRRSGYDCESVTWGNNKTQRSPSDVCRWMSHWCRSEAVVDIQQVKHLGTVFFCQFEPWCKNAFLNVFQYSHNDVVFSLVVIFAASLHTPPPLLRSSWRPTKWTWTQLPLCQIGFQSAVRSKLTDSSQSIG